MSYAHQRQRLQNGEVLLLDGGTGTELERRGARMDPGAWCGPASLESTDLLEAVHLDYIAAGADVITANTYASSRLMLAPAGFDAKFAEINQRAVDAALTARQRSGRSDLLVAGSLSHMAPMSEGTARPDSSRAPTTDEMADAFGELAALLKSTGCDLIALEMMYLPERVPLVVDAALATGLPVWMGFSARRGQDGEVLSFAPDRDIPFSDMLELLPASGLAACGVMHTASDLIEDALSALRPLVDTPLMAYPDSGYFTMPHWRFEEVIAPEAFADFGVAWVNAGVQIVGGCCGLSPAHISALSAALAREGRGAAH